MYEMGYCEINYLIFYYYIMEKLLNEMNRLSLSKLNQSELKKLNNILERFETMKLRPPVPKNVRGKLVYITKGINRRKLATVQYEQPDTYVVRINMNQSQQMKHLKKNSVEFIKN